MRFSLQDVKKHIQRRSGELTVSLHFLRPGELRTEIERLVAYHEQQIGQPQRTFSIDDARACIGDYRLAHCLVSTLSTWYTWRQCDWKDVLQRLGNDILTNLEEASITSPVHLRLALFNYVNEHFAGFLDTNKRAEALQAFAAPYHVSIGDLEYLLALDSDEEALLVRETPHPPSADEVAAVYNQWVFEAALFNASDVHFVIDCNAFMEKQKAEQGNNLPLAGIGAVIKRLCYLARKLGVYYDLAYDESGRVSLPQPPPATTPGQGQARGEARPLPYTERNWRLANKSSVLHLTLYGPQEMTGAPQQYGVRLARLCRMLLDYRVSGTSTSKGRLGDAAILEAEATVHFLQRSYRFVMDSNMLGLLPSPPGATQASPPRILPAPARTGAIFDSSIEQGFAEAFTALANSQGVEGWRLEREPEPLLLASSTGESALQGIFIPDFALTRGSRRIYVEILGFWTPAYRERKIARLQQLKGRDDLVLAIPVEAHNAFASIAQDFPIVEYDGQLSATELLKVLRTNYDDFTERLALIDVDMVRKRVQDEGLLTERTCYELLHCYRRSELQRATEQVIGENIAFTAGIGLYAIDWLERLRFSFVEWLSEASREVTVGSSEVRALSLPDILHEARVRWPVLAHCEDTALETLISLWPEVRVNRSSIFDVMVNVGTLSGTGGARFNSFASAAEESTLMASPQAAKKQVRERRPTYKKRIASETTQANLWD